jgi:endonuclease/exonuclease/phosphatase family metal-dependent hydrolase
MRRAALLCCGLWACAEPDALETPPTVVPPPVEEETPASEAAPIVDGAFDDWAPSDYLAQDPMGDASGGFDVIGLAAKARGSRLFVRIDLARPLNLYNGPPSDGTMVLELGTPDGRRLTIDFRARRAQRDDGALVPWWALELVAAPSHGASAFEVVLDLAEFGAAPGATSIDLALGGSDAVAPVAVELRHAAVAPKVLSDARAVGTELRVASLNTELGGLLDTSRAGPLARVIRAAGADVYCLQELGSASSARIASRIEAADPHNDGATWNVHVVNGGNIVGNAVASRAPLVPIPLEADRVAGAVVLTEPPVAVVSVHLKCCGYQGSGEDSTRLSQVDALSQALALFKSGGFGPELAAYRNVPILVMGDFNDVGSEGLTGALASTRTPLALERLPLRHLARGDVFTWSEYNTGFPPATLDLLLYQDATPLGGFVLDSAAFPADRLETLGLRAGDSEGSDHFMLVADFAIGR